MLRFEINHYSDSIDEADVVLLDIPYWKTYLSTPLLAHEQSAQKGPTCWYYAMNYLRVRYGSSFPNQTEKDRLAEKIISNYRKKQTLLAQAEKASENLKKLFPIRPITKNSVTNLIAHFTQSVFSKSVPKAFINGLQQFLNQQRFNTLEEYSSNNLLATMLKNSFDTFKELAICMNLPLYDHFIFLYNFQIELLRTKGFINVKNEVEALNNTMSLAIGKLAIKSYQLQTSSWKPTDGISALIDALRQNGPCYVEGKIGRSYYQNGHIQNDAKLIDENFGKRKLYEFNVNDYRPDNINHAIVIVGAKKINDIEEIYYLDPNDANSPNESKVYKLFYSEFTSYLCPISFTENECFALHANVERMQNLYQTYQNLAEISQDTDTLEELLEDNYTENASPYSIASIRHN